jgi:hypothetical protein
LLLRLLEADELDEESSDIQGYIPAEVTASSRPDKDLVIPVDSMDDLRREVKH